jgi:hypothetical protein
VLRQDEDEEAAADQHHRPGHLQKRFNKIICPPHRRSGVPDRPNL